MTRLKYERMYYQITIIRTKDIVGLSVPVTTVIMKTYLFKYTENFTTKKWKFSDKNLIFFMFLLKT